jgi:hypothetical protein
MEPEVATIEAFRHLKAIFEANPWGLRKERDLHWILAARISHRLTSGNEPWIVVTSPVVHLEFPTQRIPSYAKKGRRGSRSGDIDVTIFDEPFLDKSPKRIPPRVVIELGFDHPTDHVRKDVEKIADWVAIPEAP